MKKKHILLTILLILITFDVVYACATCFGDPNSKATQGMNMAIIALLTVTGGVLSSFISFIYILNKNLYFSLIDRTSKPTNPPIINWIAITRIATRPT